MSSRKPAVAGSFYPSDREELSRSIDDCYVHPLGPGRRPPAAAGSWSQVACIVPHAGYAYSGPVAAHSYLEVSSLRDPDLIVVVGPNHYGIGGGVSTLKGGIWETPLGSVRVDSEASSKLSEVTQIVEFDPQAHKFEHSIEVQMPFLQRLYGDSVPFLPISLTYQDEETAREVAKGVAEVMKGRKGVLLASSDFTHYEPSEEARVKDRALLDQVVEMNLGSFYSTLNRLNVTACGFGAIATVMEAAKVLGMKKGVLLKYANSGDTTGDFNSVVGYASARFV